MKCVVHIGTEKTGTTLLQEWLYHNQQALSEQGIYLSNLLGEKNNRLFPSYFKSSLDDWTRAQNINTLAEKAQIFDGFLERLTLEIKEASQQHNVFLITSEHLHSRIAKRSEIKKIKDFLKENFSDVHIICYFRYQVDMAVSLYSTALKVSSTASLQNFLSNVTPDNYYYNFKSIADNWSAEFGKDNCHFKIYDRNNFTDGDLRNDFIECLPCKVDTSRLAYRIASCNEGLHRLTATTFRIVNKYFSYRDKSGSSALSINQRLKRSLQSLSSLKRGKITSPDGDQIGHQFTNSNDQFLTTYFPPGTTLPRSSGDLATQDQDVFTLDEVEELISELMGALLPLINGEGMPRLVDADADYLRKIAIAIEKKQSLKLSDANALMLLAKRARPHGPLINRKVAEYASKLK